MLGDRPAVQAALPPAQIQRAGADDAPLPDSVPEASPATREQKRFNRYDKDRDGQVTREEYLAQRRKAFAKLDRNGDGQLSFDEWAIKATTKFAAADRDKSGAMNAAEFATTAVKRKPRPLANCPPPSAPQPEES
jgi:Ca2+-binding EF-hand superfamily protein